MATIKIKVSIQEDAKRIFISDQGSTWGSPNRQGVMLMLYAVYNGSSGSKIVTDQNVFSYDTNFDNNTVSSFSIPYLQDGWHSFNLIVVPTTSTENEGNIRYNTSNSRLEIYENGLWVELSSSRWDLLLTDDYLHETQESILYSKLAIKTNCLWNDIVAKKCKDMKCASDKFWFMRGQTYALLNQFYMGRRHNAQTMLENTIKHSELI